MTDKLRIDFPVTLYGGTKAIVISTRTVMGGKNPFLGIAYVVVGGICIVLGALFTVTHLVKPRYVCCHNRVMDCGLSLPSHMMMTLTGGAGSSATTHI